MSHRTVVSIGPFHPLQEEPEFFQLYVDGETVVDVDVRLSYNHRGIEKLNESKTFDQVPFVVERVCGICSASHPLAYIQAVEEIAHVKVPERALYLRTIVNELERLHSHLLWVGLAGHFLGYNTVFMWAWKYREPVMEALEVTTGSRVNYANCKIGGVRRDMTAEQLQMIDKVCTDLVGPLEMLTKAVLDDPILHARLKKVGVLKPADAKVEAIPPGEGVGHVEAPRGETFHYVRSDGSNRPIRHKIRAPSYVNIPTFKAS
ncbi:MAG: nickel-dependent hydrogenase large subunit, partial [Phycisphaerae bacterium]|nr:nickel-dependent hydrogenase large subunit [Phycisphaerae bacterium]